MPPVAAQATGGICLLWAGPDASPASARSAACQEAGSAGDRRDVSAGRWGHAAGLGEPEWAQALESIAARCAGRPTRLRVLAPGAPDAPGAGPYPLLSITYDARAQEVRVGLGAPGAAGPALRCFIAAPRDL